VVDGGMRQGYEWRTQQELRLEARMLQSTRVLQLPAHELANWLAEEAAANEALLVEERCEATFPEPRAQGSAGRTAAGWQDDRPEDQAALGPDLGELLGEQIGWLDLEHKAEAWARLVARALDGNGWLTASDEELLDLAAREGLEPSRGALGAAIATVQRLEPRGVGGRDAIEALLLQLDPAASDYPLLCRLLEEFLDDLAHNRLPRVARALGIELAELEALLARLGELDPRPAAGMGGRDAPPVTPDVVVERDEDGVLRVAACGAGLPDVGLDEAVLRLARDPSQARAVREHLMRRMDQAQAIVEAVRQRRETLLAVASAAFRRQRSFLEHGPGHLVTLRMGEIALELGLHKSTVSRAVAGKHAQTPWGILALRDLFQAPAGDESNGAREQVREVLRRLFAAEDRLQPLSDDDAVLALEQRGLRIARRTVAKYRAELGIQSSYRRRRHGA
jgi:RNA polymerase sigma-54 factor